MGCLTIKIGYNQWVYQIINLIARLKHVLFPITKKGLVIPNDEQIFQGLNRQMGIMFIRLTIQIAMAILLLILIMITI